MKKLVLLLLMAGLALTAAAADVSGKWSGTFATEQNPNGSAFAVLKQTGTAVTGTAGPNENEQWKISKGSVSGGKVNIDVLSNDGVTYACVLVQTGDDLKGDVTVTTGDGQKLTGKLTLTRVK